MSLAPDAVAVQSGARLHFGLLTQGHETGRRSGGLGLMIDQPGWSLSLTPAPVDTLLAPPAWHDRLAALLARIRQAQAAPLPMPGVTLEVLHAPPAHGGFGSGTQLGLAVAWGLSQLARESPPSVLELARRAGRGLRSALGIHGFALGGLLLEAGQSERGQIGPLIARVETPAHWRIVLLQPGTETSADGLAGDAETQALGRLPPMPSATTDRLCGLAVRHLLPAAQEQRFDEFAEALWEYGSLVGDYFAPVQGGRFANRRLAGLVPRVRELGFPGIAQTSWGPTLAVACASEAAGRELQTRLQREAPDVTTLLAQPSNRGVL